jgi:hypothetical protein
MLKTVSSISNPIGALNYKGTWNATTNSPALASGVGTKGDYYVVGTAGTTTLDGISNWGVGDWAAFNGTAWQRVEGGADLNGVNLSVSGTATFAAGAVGTPAITTSGDTNTGVFFPAADTIALGTGGVEALRSNSSQNVLINATSNAFCTSFTGAGHIVRNPTVTTNTKILEVCGGSDTSVPTLAVFYNANNTAMNAANSTVKIGLMAATSRSINAAGSINASGADYAEYMTKAGDFTVAKGDVVGINAEGKLTNVFADAVSFCVKSTSPSYVGGDVWGVGFENDEQGLEQARQKVDRIAFAGQVPVNVLGATPGQYIVPFNENGAIKGQAISNPTFEQYQSAVGKVIAVEQDGRARVIVKIS